MKGAIRKNLLTERIDIVKPLGWYRDSPTLTDVDVKYLLLYFEENYGLTVEKKIIDAVAVIANENRYHPVCDFLNALQWDGTERIRFCLHRFLGSDTDDYTYEALKLFLLGAISRAFKPGCKFEVASELGVPLSDGYNGNLTSKQNGSVGGYMVKKMIEQQERQMSGGSSGQY